MCALPGGIALAGGSWKLSDEFRTGVALDLKTKCVQQFIQLVLTFPAVTANRRQGIGEQPQLVDQIHHGPLVRIHILRVAGNLIAAEIIHVLETIILGIHTEQR